MPRSVATPTAIGLPVSVVGAFAYVVQHSPAPDPRLTGYVFWPAFVGIALRSILAAPLGARLAMRVPIAVLRRGFASLLFASALAIVLE